MPEDPQEVPDRPEADKRRDWRDVAAAWQQLSPEEQLRRRLERIPEKVAKSMAFAGEPVDVEMLRRHLEELLQKYYPDDFYWIHDHVISK